MGGYVNGIPNNQSGAAPTPAPAPDPAPTSPGDSRELISSLTPGEAPPDPADPADAPIELDLDGNGISVTPLTSSNLFETIDEDGYEHRTAWAGTGDAVLFYDPNGLNAIKTANQYIFTDWDPSATTDMGALKDVFDTNHDGKLDAGDAGFADFKLMVTNADGTTSVETLAQAGVTAIDLTENSVTRTFSDGSTIDGETTFTKSDGTTGTVASVTYAAEANGYSVETTTTANADGSTTVDTVALNGNGSLASETIETTSADGLSRTLQYDDAGERQRSFEDGPVFRHREQRRRRAAGRAYPQFGRHDDRTGLGCRQRRRRLQSLCD